MHAGKSSSISRHKKQETRSHIDLVDLAPDHTRIGTKRTKEAVAPTLKGSNRHPERLNRFASPLIIRDSRQQKDGSRSCSAFFTSRKYKVDRSVSLRSASAPHSLKSKPLGIPVALDSNSCQQVKPTSADLDHTNLLESADTLIRFPGPIDGRVTDDEVLYLNPKPRESSDGGSGEDKDEYNEIEELTYNSSSSESNDENEGPLLVDAESREGQELLAEIMNWFRFGNIERPSEIFLKLAQSREMIFKGPRDVTRSGIGETGHIPFSAVQSRFHQHISKQLRRIDWIVTLQRDVELFPDNQLHLMMDFLRKIQGSVPECGHPGKRDSRDPHANRRRSRVRSWSPTPTHLRFDR
ncbi:hypothetical protein BX600DRAFT_432190 [Xylariales sp. PMI_506]|nr:hypothetical protein BX600DRAFT_432190 [Xylariales sp. PMI_506]